MTQKFNVNIVRNFANWGMPYYGFNYVEGGRTNAIHIHKDHPIFKRIEAPKAKK
jgi:hypothetical protein